MTKETVKEAMPDSERNALIGAAVLAAASTAGIGAVIRSNRAKKMREKAKDTERSRNAIVVPIKKTKFLEGLPTPDELAESRGETSPALVTSQPVLEAPAEAIADASSENEMTPEEIEAKKKAILAANSRKFNFFGKAAASRKDDIEKKADGSWETAGSMIDSALHPFESLKQVGRVAADKPLATTAIAVGGFYLAAMIADAINKRRREKSRNRIEDARSEYVGLLEGNEKVAGDVRDWTGTILGTSFFVPLALSAIITNKIIKNRKAEKAKEKEQSDTYPDEPIIMYKTSEAEEIPMSASTALAVIAFNRELLKQAEVLSHVPGIEKLADDFSEPVGVVVGIAGDDVYSKPMAELARNIYAGGDVQGAGKKLFRDYVMNNGGTEKDVVDMMDGEYGIWDGVSDRWKGKFNGKTLGDLKSLRKAYENPQRFISALASSQDFRKKVAERFANDENFKSLKNDIVDGELANTWVGRTFNKDGWIYRFIKWLGDITGYTNSKFNSGLNGVFDYYADPRNFANAQNGSTHPTGQKEQANAAPARGASGSGGGQVKTMPDGSKVRIVR